MSILTMFVYIFIKSFDCVADCTLYSSSRLYTWRITRADSAFLCFVLYKLFIYTAAKGLRVKPGVTKVKIQCWFGLTGWSTWRSLRPRRVSNRRGWVGRGSWVPNPNPSFVSMTGPTNLDRALREQTYIFFFLQTNTTHHPPTHAI